MDYFKKDDFNEALGSFIKQGRNARGILQRDLCEHIGISQGFYSQLENGERNADLLLVVKIFGFLNLDFRDFLRKNKPLVDEIVHHKGT